MRKIKFRAWDKDARKMTTHDGDFSKHIRIGLDGTLYWEGRDMSRDFVITRFTGLTDKNGVEIYEGDICRDSLGWVFKVVWDSDNARFLGQQEKLRGDTYICYVGRIPAVEVIGNLFDNPELLEVAE